VSGFLIAFEGNEGAGKSTQIERAAEALRASGHRVRLTREPGGTRLGLELRRLVMHTQPPPVAPAELFLYLADRAQHLAEVIRPALAAGEIVLTDRFSASTIAYQGSGRGLDFDSVVRADAFSRGGTTPHLNILLSCPVRAGLSRARGADRFHDEDETFHERVREGFLRLAAGDPDHWCTIDATRDADEVHRAVMEAISAVIG
jgi:dTMP kinase